MRKLICIALVLAAISGCFTAVAEDKQVFIFCNPKTPVIIRKMPQKGSDETGRLEFGDWVTTDGRKKNGFVHVTGITEAGDGWIFAGYIIDNQPERLDNAWANVAANGRVMSYRWINGRRNGWVQVGDDIRIYGISDEWAVTDKGYIRTKYLEVWYE